MVSPTEIAQQLFQGQIAQVAPTTGIAPQPQLRPEQEAIAQALQQQQAPQRQIAPPQGVSLANELLSVSQDRLGNPIIRGLAGFLGARELQKERERVGTEKRAITEAKAKQQEIENIRAEEAFALKEQVFALKQETSAAQIGKLEAETEKLGRPAALTPFQKQSLELREKQLKATTLDKPFTTVQKDEFRESRNQLQSGLDAVRALKKTLKEDPTRFGAAGTARGIGESALGILGDIGGIFGLGGAAAGAREAVSGDTVRGLRPIESKLATAVARARSGTTGRLNVDQLRTARENVSITGLFGSGQAGDSLNAIEKEIQDSLTALGGRAQAGGFDLKLKQSNAAKDATDEDILRILGL